MPKVLSKINYVQEIENRRPSDSDLTLEDSTSSSTLARLHGWTTLHPQSFSFNVSVDTNNPQLSKELAALLYLHSNGLPLVILFDSLGSFSRKRFTPGVLGVFHCLKCLAWWQKTRKLRPRCREIARFIQGPTFNMTLKDALMLSDVLRWSNKFVTRNFLQVLPSLREEPSNTGKRNILSSLERRTNTIAGDTRKSYAKEAEERKLRNKELANRTADSFRRRIFANIAITSLLQAGIDLNSYNDEIMEKISLAGIRFQDGTFYHGFFSKLSDGDIGTDSLSPKTLNHNGAISTESQEDEQHHGRLILDLPFVAKGRFDDLGTYHPYYGENLDLTHQKHFPTLRQVIAAQAHLDVAASRNAMNARIASRLQKNAASKTSYPNSSPKPPGQNIQSKADQNIIAAPDLNKSTVPPSKAEPAPQVRSTTSRVQEELEITMEQSVPLNSEPDPSNGTKSSLSAGPGAEITESDSTTVKSVPENAAPSTQSSTGMYKPDQINSELTSTEESRPGIDGSASTSRPSGLEQKTIADQDEINGFKADPETRNQPPIDEGSTAESKRASDAPVKQIEVNDEQTSRNRFSSDLVIENEPSLSRESGPETNKLTKSTVSPNPEQQQTSNQSDANDSALEPITENNTSLITDSALDAATNAPDQKLKATIDQSMENDSSFIASQDNPSSMMDPISVPDLNMPAGIAEYSAVSQSVPKLLKNADKPADDEQDSNLLKSLNQDQQPEFTFALHEGLELTLCEILASGIWYKKHGNEFFIAGVFDGEGNFCAAYCLTKHGFLIPGNTDANRHFVASCNYSVNQELEDLFPIEQLQQELHYTLEELRKRVACPTGSELHTEEVKKMWSCVKNGVIVNDPVCISVFSDGAFGTSEDLNLYIGGELGKDGQLYSFGSYKGGGFVPGAQPIVTDKGLRMFQEPEAEAIHYSTEEFAKKFGIRLSEASPRTISEADSTVGMLTENKHAAPNKEEQKKRKKNTMVFESLYKKIKDKGDASRTTPAATPLQLQIKGFSSSASDLTKRIKEGETSLTFGPVMKRKSSKGTVLPTSLSKAFSGHKMSDLQINSSHKDLRGKEHGTGSQTLLYGGMIVHQIATKPIGGEEAITPARASTVETVQSEKHSFGGIMVHNEEDNRVEQFATGLPYSDDMDKPKQLHEEDKITNDVLDENKLTVPEVPQCSSSEEESDSTVQDLPQKIVHERTPSGRSTFIPTLDEFSILNFTRNYQSSYFDVPNYVKEYNQKLMRGKITLPRIRGAKSRRRSSAASSASSG